MADEENSPYGPTAGGTHKLLDAAFVEECTEAEHFTSVQAGILCTVYYLLLDKTPPVIKKLLAGTPTSAITFARQRNLFTEVVVGYNAELRREFIVWATEMADQIAASQIRSGMLEDELDYDIEDVKEIIRNNVTLGKDDRPTDGLPLVLVTDEQRGEHRRRMKEHPPELSELDVLKAMCEKNPCFSVFVLKEFVEEVDKWRRNLQDAEFMDAVEDLRKLLSKSADPVGN